MYTSVEGYKKDTSIQNTKKEINIDETYESDKVESNWYSYWMKNRLFVPKEDINEDIKDDNKFVMVLPPPNVTGTLHLGHALTISIEDALVRWNRMNNKITLWIPGLDHAGIATQVVVEKQQYREKKIKRHEMKREDFINEVWKWKKLYGNTILQQCRRLGASLDWEHERFTMDNKCSKAVIEAFIRMANDGIIYRDNRIVTWSCQLRSAISTIEIDHKEYDKSTMINIPGYDKEIEVGVLHYFSYKIKELDEKVMIATTRIETMLGDVAIAINSNDIRYKHLIGKNAIHPFINDRLLPIIVDDELVKIGYGTGAVKITPGHDPNDFQCGLRNKLPIINILNIDGTICDGYGKYSNMNRFDARIEIINDLKILGLYNKKEDNPMSIGFCSRTNDIIEPVVRPQWWINCKDMAKRSIDAVKDGKLKIIPETFNDTWYTWLDNIQDWCISRQLWWGHRIPAYNVVLSNDKYKYDVNNDNMNRSRWIIARDIDEAKLIANKRFINEEYTLIQDEDVLDTWFSSGLFPFSTLGWPDITDDFKKYFPTTSIETGHDILFFWVARMVMLSLQLTNKLPFNTIILHNIIRDRSGRKMSKTLGNVIDPLDVINGITLNELQDKLLKGNLNRNEINNAMDNQKIQFPNGIQKCGSDALRFGLLSYAGQNRDINLDINKIYSSRAFCNKIWQATRFIFINLKNTNDIIYPQDIITFTNILNKVSVEDLLPQRWILSKFYTLVYDCNIVFTKTYEFADAVNSLYKFFIDDFCSYFLEICKSILHSKDDNNCINKKNIYMITLYFILYQYLHLMHPFMPYLTEEIHNQLIRFNTSKININENESKEQNDIISISIQRYPNIDEYKQLYNKDVENDMNIQFLFINSIRSIRNTLNITNKTQPIVYILCKNIHDKNIFIKDTKYLNDLINIKEIYTYLYDDINNNNQDKLKGCIMKVINSNITIYIRIDTLIDTAMEVVRTEKKLEQIQNLKDNLDKIMSVPEYKQANQDIRQKHINKYNELLIEIKSLNEAIENLHTVVHYPRYLEQKIDTLNKELEKLIKYWNNIVPKEYKDSNIITIDLKVLQDISVKKLQSLEQYQKQACFIQDKIDKLKDELSQLAL